MVLNHDKENHGLELRQVLKQNETTECHYQKVREITLTSLLIFFSNALLCYCTDTMQPYRNTGASNAMVNKSGTRKSFAEALEDILNPVYESEKDRATPVIPRNAAASPDNISVTVVGNESITSSSKGIKRRNSSVADNINSALSGTLEENWSEMGDNVLSKSSDHSREANKKINYRKSADNVTEEVWVKNYKAIEKLHNGSNKDNANSALNRLRNSALHTRQNSAPAVPVQNCKNSAPAVPVQSSRERRRQQVKSWDESKENYDYNKSNEESPTFAPRSRREVAPEYSQR